MTTNKAPSSTDTALCAEYDLDYTRSRPNRFAAETRDTVVVVTLEPDVPAVFGTSESVNRALRSLISAQTASKPRARHPPES
ncbi:MAG: hypothetical protein OXH69_19945 [Acidobacteria bacterium]|nr:hypothetical protein [Acidobacteriota bacterium]